MVVSFAVLFAILSITGSFFWSTSVGLGFGGAASDAGAPPGGGLFRVDDAESVPGAGAVLVREALDLDRHRPIRVRLEIRGRRLIAGQHVDPEHETGHRFLDVVRAVAEGVHGRRAGSRPHAGRR